MLYFFYWFRLSFSVVGLECSFQMCLRANAFHNIIVKFNVVIKEFCLICIDFAQKFSRADEIVVHAKQTDLLMNSPLLLFVISFIFLFTFLTCTHQVFQFPYLSLFFYSHPSPVGCAQQEYRIWNSSCIAQMVCSSIRQFSPQSHFRIHLKSPFYERFCVLCVDVGDTSSTDDFV